MTPMKTFRTPTGGTYTRNVKGGGKTRRSKSKGKSRGGAVTHKAYSYTNSRGKLVHVPSHIEHPWRGGKGSKPRSRSRRRPIPRKRALTPWYEAAKLS